MVVTISRNIFQINFRENAEGKRIYVLPWIQSKERYYLSSIFPILFHFYFIISFLSTIKSLNKGLLCRLLETNKLNKTDDKNKILGQNRWERIIKFSKHKFLIIASLNHTIILFKIQHVINQKNGKVTISV